MGHFYFSSFLSLLLPSHPRLTILPFETSAFSSSVTLPRSSQRQVFHPVCQSLFLLPVFYNIPSPVSHFRFLSLFSLHSFPFLSFITLTSLPSFLPHVFHPSALLSSHLLLSLLSSFFHSSFFLHIRESPEPQNDGHQNGDGAGPFFRLHHLSSSSFLLLSLFLFLPRHAVLSPFSFPL